MLNLQHVDLKDKRVTVRADLNVAVCDGKIQSDQRIRSSLETIRYALDANASVRVLSHFGRPKEGEFDAQYSLMPVRDTLQQLLGREVRFVSHWLGGDHLQPGQVALCENVRFLKGETSASDTLSRKMAQGCDVFVMDAFATAHRNHASTCAIVNHVPVACAGLLLQREIDSLNRALANPISPVVSIVGGAKVEGKLQILKKLSRISDTLIVGGGIANTFLAASGMPIGNSLYEPQLLVKARNIVKKAARRRCSIPLPDDVVVGTDYEPPNLNWSGTGQLHHHETAGGVLPDAVYRTPFCQPYTRTAQKNIADVGDDDKILDVGPNTAQHYSAIVAEAATVIWNGPVGAFEHAPFENGTRKLAQAVAQSDAFSIAGGGDTIAALQRFDCMGKVSYVSTGGGAFLEYLRSKPLPAIAALQHHQVGLGNQQLAG